MAAVLTGLFVPLSQSADFGGSKAKCLMNADVALILEHKREMMQAKGIQPKRCHGDMLKSLQFCRSLLCAKHSRAAPISLSPHARARSPADSSRVCCNTLPSPSDFLKSYQYVNTVKQFRDKEVASQVRK